MTGENQQARLGAAMLPPVRAEPLFPSLRKPPPAGGRQAASNTDLSRGHSGLVSFPFVLFRVIVETGRRGARPPATGIRGLSAPSVAAQLSSVQARLHGTALRGSRAHRPGL